MENKTEMESFESALSSAKKLIDEWSLEEAEQTLQTILAKTQHQTNPAILYLHLQVFMEMGKTQVILGLLSSTESERCFRRARSLYKQAEIAHRHLLDLPVEKRKHFDLDHSPGTAILFIDFDLLQDFQTTTSAQNLSQQAGM